MLDGLRELAFESAGATLYGYDWPARGSEPATTYVVMSHGLTNHHEDAPMFELLRDRFLERRLGVFMFDYFGSGKSDGSFEEKTWSGMRQNLADALDLVSATMIGSDASIALVARSVGASIAALFVKDPRVSCSVLASPVMHLIERFGYIPGPGNEEPVAMPDNIERSGQIKGRWALNRRFFDELETTEREIEKAVTGASDVLVIHGERDPKVAVSNSQRLFELLSEPKRFLGVEGADHYFTGVEAIAADTAVEWVAGYASRTHERLTKAPGVE
jgi:alpha-beta hydrolase superfamily lysophospholipase